MLAICRSASKLFSQRPLGIKSSGLRPRLKSNQYPMARSQAGRQYPTFHYFGIPTFQEGGEAPILTLYERRWKKDLFIEVQGIAVGHGGDDVTDGALFRMIVMVAPVHFQFDQLLLKNLVVFKKIVV